MSDLCPDCRVYDEEWANAKVDQGGVRIHVVGRSTVRDVEEGRRARLEDHKRLVDFQREHGRLLCAQGRHYVPKKPAKPAPADDQFADELRAAERDARAAAEFSSGPGPAPLGVYRPWDTGLR